MIQNNKAYNFATYFSTRVDFTSKKTKGISLQLTMCVLCMKISSHPGLLSMKNTLKSMYVVHGNYPHMYVCCPWKILSYAYMLSMKNTLTSIHVVHGKILPSYSTFPILF